jgi:hypothetical protein
MSAFTLGSGLLRCRKPLRIAYKREIEELILHLNVCVFTQVRFVIYEEKQKVSVVANIHFDSSFLRK